VTVTCTRTTKSLALLNCLMQATVWATHVTAYPTHLCTWEYSKNLSCNILSFVNISSYPLFINTHISRKVYTVQYLYVCMVQFYGYLCVCICWDRDTTWGIVYLCLVDLSRGVVFLFLFFFILFSFVVILFLLLAPTLL